MSKIDKYLHNQSSSYFEEELFEPNESDVNYLICKSLLEIKQLTKSAIGGHHFDQNAQNIFLDNLSSAGFNLIEHKDWMKNYKDYRQRVLECSNNGVPYDFSNIETSNILDRVIIDKPNGANNYPDILIIFNNTGMGFECKTNAKDSVSWGMTIPHDNIIYLFNSYRKIGKSTFFLGSDLINKEERFLLEQFQKFFKFHAKEANEHLKKTKSSWKTNVNLIWSNTHKLFSNESDRKQKEDNVLEFIKNFKW